MSGQDDNKGGIASFSIGLGNSGPQAVPIAPAPPFRVLIAGDFGLKASRSALNITGLDIAEILEPNAPAFSVTVDNLLGSLPAQLEEQIRFASLKDLRPAKILSGFRFTRDLEAAAGDPDRLAASGQLYDKAAEALRIGGNAPAEKDPSSPLPSYDDGPAEQKPTGAGTDGLDSLFSMIDMSGGKDEPKDSSSLAKAAVDAFIQDTLREEGGVQRASSATTETSPAVGLQLAQSALFFADAKLSTVLQNWHSLKLLLSELETDLPLELHLLQVDQDLDAETLGDLLDGPSGALQAELYDIVLLADPTGIAGREAAKVKVLTNACADSDTVGLLNLTPDFSGMPGEELGGLDAAHQFLDTPGYEGFEGLRESEQASHLALFWNEARLSAPGDGYPGLYAAGAWVALAMVLTQLQSEAFPKLPVGTPVDFDALEVAEGQSKGRVVATAARFITGHGLAPSLAQCGINVLEGVANRTDLVFRRGVTVKPGKEGRGSLDQALLVSRLFSLFQEALGGAVTGGQSAEDREAAVTRNLNELSAALSGQVAFEVRRVTAEDQDLIGVTAVIRSGWATGQQHSFYLPASDG
ncbi:type VI secretion system contractile sheath small subunit [Labrenzia sp. VG12]|uniref:type VI secretion system contractile sheath small subunit n=1 Tax=Labrenzia sp. VG12 TaxID=2021862 RepID=UPI000B8C1F2F|nr:type VI secretion system contractile sheath small subunit [Labrenzia sp. VG12]ASP35434.1 hypothetical protein CHH27_21140 [Labrenzia sp. VG12]